MCVCVCVCVCVVHALIVWCVCVCVCAHGVRVFRSCAWLHGFCIGVWVWVDGS